MKPTLGAAKGARPAHLSAPVPGEDQEMDLSEYIQPVDGPKEMPMTQQAPAPAPIPSEMAPQGLDQGMDLSEYLEPSKETTPVAASDTAEYLANKNQDSGYGYVGNNVRFSPTGGWQVREKNMWADAPAQFQHFAEKFLKDDALRILGGTAGAIAGGAAGVVGGPGGVLAGSVAGSAVGTAAGGAAANALQGKEAAGTVGADLASGAVAALIPPAVSRFLAGQARQFGRIATMETLATPGAEALAQRVKGRAEASAQEGIPLRSDQLMFEDPMAVRAVDAIMKRGGPEAMKLVEFEAGQQAKLKQSFDRVRTDLVGPYEMSDVVGKTTNFAEFVNKIQTNREISIASDTKKLFDAVGTKSFNGKVKELSDDLREILKERLGSDLFQPNGSLSVDAFKSRIMKHGPFSAEQNAQLREYTRLKNALRKFDAKAKAGDTTSGFTLEDIDSLRRRHQDYGKFRKDTLGEEQRTWNEIAHKTRVRLDEAMIDAADGVGMKEVAQRLRADKDFYKNNIENVRIFQKQLEGDPTNAAMALLDFKSPASVKNLFAILDPEHQAAIKGGALDMLTQPAFDPITGRIKMTASYNQWQKMDPAVKVELFGKEAPRIDALINLAKVVDARRLEGYTPEADNLVRRMMGIVKSPSWTGGATFIKSLLPNNAKAADVLAGAAYKKISQDGGASAAEKASARLAQSQAWVVGNPGFKKRMAGSLGAVLAPQERNAREVQKR